MELPAPVDRRMSVPSKTLCTKTPGTHLPENAIFLSSSSDADTEQVTARNKGDVENQKKSSPRSIIFSCTPQGSCSEAGFCDSICVSTGNAPMPRANMLAHRRPQPARAWNCGEIGLSHCVFTKYARVVPPTQTACTHQAPLHRGRRRHGLPTVEFSAESLEISHFTSWWKLCLTREHTHQEDEDPKNQDGAVTPTAREGDKQGKSRKPARSRGNLSQPFGPSCQLQIVCNAP